MAESITPQFPTFPVTTECGHIYPSIVNPEVKGSDYSTDCAVCGTLLMVVWNEEKGEYEHKLFHKWLHEQDPAWPEDGAGTGYVEF